MNYWKKGKLWEWTTECQQAFEKIKKILTSDLFLTHYNPDLEIIVASDSSSYDIGSCSLHKMTDGTSKPIAHSSRALLAAEKNYSQIEKEALAIIFAVSKFHRFIYGRYLILQTDHKPLLTIFGSKNGLPTHTANRLQRWGTILLNYNFKMEYLPSNKYGRVDGLSRLIPKYREPFEDTVIASLQSEGELKTFIFNSIREFPVTLEQIKQEAFRDKYITRRKFY